MDKTRTAAFRKGLEGKTVGGHGQGERLRVFYDEDSLKPGKDFVRAMLTALSQARVVTPFVTCEALQRLQDPSKLRERDNMLLEWWLALVLLDKEIIGAIHPILFGSVSGRCRGTVKWTLNAVLRSSGLDYIGAQGPAMCQFV